MIKTLFSLQPHHEYLSDYDRAIINEVVGGKKDKFKKLKVPSHHELISVVQALYSIDPDITERGICFGIAHMRRQAFFSGKTDVFSKRLKNIKYNVCPLIQKAMKEVKAEGINPTNQNLLFNKLREKLQNQFPYSTWYDLYAFLDGVILYFNSSKFPQLFDKKTPLNQLALPAEPLLRPTNVMGLPSQHVFSGYYTKSTLSTYFECLDNALKPFKGSVFFGISVGNHTFTLEYTKGKWIYTDANYLDEGEKKRTSHEIAQLLLKYYKSPLIFAAKPFIVPDSAESFNQCMDVLIKDPKWTDLHEQITKEQSTQKNSNGNTLLHIAAAYGDVATIKRFVAAGVPCNLQGRDGATLLYKAANNGQLDIVKELLKALKGDKAAINKPQKDDITALYVAAYYGHIDIVKELLKALKGDKAAINKPQKDDITALYAAACYGHIDIVKELLNALKGDKEAINAPRNNGATALYIAAQQGFPLVVEELLKNGADLTKSMQANPNILLEVAKKQNCKEKVHTLFAKKEISDTLPGFTALHAAVCFGHREVVKLLVKNSEVFETPPQGISVYQLAEAMNRMDGLPPNLQQDHQLKNGINLIKPLLKEYKKARKIRFQFKDRINSEDKNTREAFIKYLINESNFRDSGIEGLIKAIRKGIKQFPGAHFQSTLNLLILKLVDDTPDEEYAEEAKKTLKNQKNTQIVKELDKLYKKIEAMHQFATNLTPTEKQTVISLATQLKKDLDFFICQYPQERLDAFVWKRFEIKFKARLYSKDTIMRQQENWKSFALNLILAVITIGLALAIKAIHSKATTGQVTFFARETEKQKRRKELHQLMDEVKNSLGPNLG